MKSKLINRFFGWFVIIIFAAGVYFIVQAIIRASRPDISVQTTGDQSFKLIKLKNDSLYVLKQKVAFYESRSPLLQDSLIRSIVAETKIKPSVVVQWASVAKGREENIQLKDSLSDKIEALMLSQDQLVKLNDSERKKYYADKDALVNARIPFVDSAKYYKIKGDYGINSKINIEREFYTEPYLIFGDETPILGLGKTKYSVLLGDKNPDAKILSAKNAFYSPKPKVELSIGPSFLINKKYITTGVSANFKKGILSGSIGYIIDHRQFR